MNRKGFVFSFLLTALCMMAVMGCASGAKAEHNPVIGTDAGKDYATIEARGVSFESEAGSLTMNNQTSYDVIVFAGRVEGGNVLGGIKAGARRGFDLSKIKGIPEKGSILIRVTSFESYSRKNFRVTEEDVVYSGLVVYDFADPGDRTDMNIYKNMDQTQSTFIYISNKSPNYVLEVRLDHPNGEKIATLPPLLENKKIWIKPNDDGLGYRLYPTYVYVDPATNEITSIPPTDVRGSRRVLPDAPGGLITPIEFNSPVGDAVAYNLAFVRVINDTNLSIDFRNAGTIFADQKGNRLIMDGRSAVFEVPSESGEEGQLYTNLRVRDDYDDEMVLDEVMIQPGFVYDLTVTNRDGNMEYDIAARGKKSKIDDARISLYLES
ncbi:MAG: hypothetical protein LBU99_06205 [Spirochaetaceae bacterium]|nr:hypothetical protein [Spirochaetaceae bacterium]